MWSVPACSHPALWPGNERPLGGCQWQLLRKTKEENVTTREENVTTREETKRDDNSNLQTWVRCQPCHSNAHEGSRETNQRGATLTGERRTWQRTGDTSCLMSHETFEKLFNGNHRGKVGGELTFCLGTWGRF